MCLSLSKNLVITSQHKSGVGTSVCWCWLSAVCICFKGVWAGIGSDVMFRRVDEALSGSLKLGGGTLVCWCWLLSVYSCFKGIRVDLGAAALFLTIVVEK